MAIIATPGAANANSYGTLIEAEAHLANNPDLEIWDDATDQEESLIWATTQMDFAISWIGQKATGTQSLEWPRMDDDDGVFSVPVADTVIPEGLKKFQFEAALYRLKVQASGGSTDTLPISSLKVGNQIEAKYDTAGFVSTSTATLLGFPVASFRFIKGLWTPALFA